MWAPLISNITPIVAALAAALSGSLHCVGMCGPIRLLSRSKGSAWKYQGGRGLAYATLGLGAGGFGATLPFRWLLTLVLVGGLFLFFPLPPQLKTISQKARSRLLPLLPSGPFFWGLSSGLLPCGMLHAWLIAAAATASATQGALLLLALWLGTIPALEASTGFLAIPMAAARKRFPVAVPLSLFVLAVLPIWYRKPLNLSKPQESHCHHLKAP